MLIFKLDPDGSLKLTHGVIPELMFWLRVTTVYKFRQVKYVMM